METLNDINEYYPNILYKFKSLENNVGTNDKEKNNTNKHTFQILKEGKLYFSSARKFNDPFDTSLNYNFKANDEEIKEWLDDSFERHKKEAFRRGKTKKQIFQEVKTKKRRNYVKQKVNKDLKTKYGICSLSASKDNILLWSHYTNNHKGVCIGLNTKKIIEFMDQKAKMGIVFDLQDIDYKKEMPKINFFESMKQINVHNFKNSDLYKLLYTKSKDWNYEKEYRFILYDQTNKIVSIGNNIISEIILGCRISSDNKKLILDICNGYEHKPKVYQAKTSNKKFELEFEQIL